LVHIASSYQVSSKRDRRAEKKKKIVLKNGTAEELTFAFGSVILSLENIR
jgi:cellobiose phosphorylase